MSLTTARAKASAAARWVWARFELRDLAFVVGLSAVLTGGFELSRPWTLVAVGCFLLLISIPWRRA